MEKTSHGHGRDLIRGNMLLLTVIVVGMCVEVLGGKTTFEEDFNLKRHLKLLNKPAIKTIKSEDGDIIDCVDIYKQPAFDHPLLQNHTLQNVVLVAKGDFYGAKAQINVWNIHVEPNELSASKITLLSDSTSDASSIQAGWLIHPQLFGDYQTRFFTYWTGDGSKNTGCFNLVCPGFVQVSQEISLGAVISPSTYEGEQKFIELLVYKDPKNKDWWLVLEGKVIGYWPTSIFKNLESASFVQWGGEVLNTATDGHHTITQMGSGHFPSEGFGKSSFFKNILLVDSSNAYFAPERAVVLREKPDCYDLTYEGRRWGKDQGTYFYYGGPGRGPNCL